MRYAARRDSNDALIADALRQVGFTIIDFARAGQGIPDYLAVKTLPDGTPWACWVEVKTPTGRLKPAQEAFRAVFEPMGQFYLARDPEAAINALCDLYNDAIKPEHWG